MLRKPLKTTLPIWTNRYLPPSMLAEQAQQIEASGVAEDLLLWDQLTAWYPPYLWTRHSPLAAMIPDYDSFPDPWSVAGYVQHAAPNLGLTVTADAIRQGPSELMRAMLTVATMTEGRATFNFGAGEVKHCKPFGWKRSEGLARLEDLFRIFREYYGTKGPISFKGNHWTLDRAWIGDAFQYKPRFYGMGAGPRLTEIATRYADGLSTALPCAWWDTDRTTAGVANIREAVASHDRDPDDFDIAGWFCLLVHEDPNVIDRALDNPFLKFTAAIFGRPNGSDWREVGIEPPMPDGWNYALKMLPTHMGEAETEEIISRVTRPMMEQSFFYGTPAEVAAQLQKHIDAGIHIVYPLDYLAVALEPDDAAQGLRRGIELVGLLQQNDRRATPA